MTGLTREMSETIAAWRQQQDQVTVDRELVHRADPRNVVVARVARPDLNRSDEFLAQLIVDTNHPFFFEHALDHVPGMLLIEAGRQSVFLIAHSFYSVPRDTAFIADDLHYTFHSFGELEEPVFAKFVFVDKGYTGARLTRIEMTAEFIQDAEVLASGAWTSRLIWWTR